MNNVTLIPGSHSIFAPSSGHRIVTCGASLHATKDLPDESSFEAVEGSVAHEIHEHVLKTGVPASSFVGKVYDVTEHDREYTIEVTTAMANYVQESVDWCLELQGEHFVEERVRIDKWTPIPNQSGTCDHACIFVDELGSSVLAITDLKFGKGVQVFALWNVQLALYALGFLARYDWLYQFDYVEIRISQPRLDHRDTWTVSTKDLYEFGEWIKQRFMVAWLPDAPFKPEKEACRFCKLKPQCPALAELTKEIALGHFDDLTRERVNPSPLITWPLVPPNIDVMTASDMAAVNEHKSLLEGFFEAVARKMTVVLMHDGDIPNWKLVEGRSRRKWTSEAAAVSYLVTRNVPRDKLTVVKTISPAAAEKLLPKKERAGLSELIHKSVGKPTLVQASDKRPKFALTPGMLFDDLSDEAEEEEF